MIEPSRQRTPWNRRQAVFLLGILAATPLAFAQDVPLTATEIAELLRGRTAIGTWQGTPYRQFFDPDGSTIYAPRTGRSTLGKWRVDASRDLYESWWEGSGWEAWGVIRRDGNLYWTGPGIEAEPFRMMDGQQLVWPN
ncbi:MAG: hypothetical protein AAF557_16540 [Pseudomonadota bacterium]